MRSWLLFWVMGIAVADSPGPGVLNNLAVEAYQQGRLDEAEALYQQALEGWRTHPLHPRHGLWRTMTNLAAVRAAQGRLEEAEALYTEVLRGLESEGDTLELATALNNLAEMHRAAARYGRAEPLAARAVRVAGRVLAPGDARRAAYLHTLASIHRSTGRLDRAAAMFEQCRAMLERAGDSGPRLAAALNNLGEIASAQRRFEEAEGYSRRALALWESALGPDHARVAVALNNLAQAVRLQGRLPEAEPLLRRAIEILAGLPSGSKAELALYLGNLADLYHAQGKELRAVALYRRAIALMETAFPGAAHPDLALLTSRLAEVRRAQGHYTDSARLYQRSLAIAPSAEIEQAYRRTLREADQVILRAR